MRNEGVLFCLFWFFLVLGGSFAFANPLFPHQSLYRKAEAGDAQAQNKVGEIYANGKEVSKDFGEALKWFRRAARRGNEDAYRNLGWAYAFGQGVPKDPAKSYYWLLKSAGKGNAEAEFYLGLFYETGRGVKKDLEKAEGWYRKAAARGFPYAQEALERLNPINPSPTQTVGQGTEKGILP